MQKFGKSRTFIVVIFVRSEGNKTDLKFLKQIGQSCNGIREKQRGGLGAEPSAAGGKRGFGSRR